jgi:hypothetical protein
LGNPVEECGELAQLHPVPTTPKKAPKNIVQNEISQEEKRREEFGDGTTGTDKRERE